MQISSFLSLLLFCGFVISILWSVFAKALLRYNSVIVKGQITNRQINTSKYRNPWRQYSLSCRYVYNDRTFMHTEMVDEAAYHIWTEGDSVEVRCFPPFAKIARLVI